MEGDWGGLHLAVEKQDEKKLSAQVEMIIRAEQRTSSISDTLNRTLKLDSVQYTNAELEHCKKTISCKIVLHLAAVDYDYFCLKCVVRTHKLLFL